MAIYTFPLLRGFRGLRLERRASRVGTGAGNGGSWAEAEDTGSEAEIEDTGFGADTDACPRERPAREAHQRGHVHEMYAYKMHASALPTPRVTPG